MGVISQFIGIISLLISTQIPMLNGWLAWNHHFSYLNPWNSWVCIHQLAPQRSQDTHVAAMLVGFSPGFPDVPANCVSKMPQSPVPWSRCQGTGVKTPMCVFTVVYNFIYRHVKNYANKSTYIYIYNMCIYKYIYIYACPKIHVQMHLHIHKLYINIYI